MRKKGEQALHIFRAEFGPNGSKYLAEREGSKKALLNALRGEVEGIPSNGATDDFLLQINDGTYPAKGTVNRTGREGSDRDSSDEYSDGEISNGEKRDDHEQESDEGGNLDSDEGEKSEPQTRESAGIQRVLAMMKRMEKARKKDFSSLKQDQETLRKDIRKLKARGAAKGNDLLADLNRAKEGDVFGNDDEAGTDSSDSENEAARGSSSSQATKKSNSRFFRTFARRPFPDQTVLVDSLEGENMLRKALTNYPTVSAWAEARHLSGSRNKREAATLAKIIDCIIDSLGILRAKNEPAIELAIRRLAAVVMADRTGSWAAARELEEEHDELVSESQRRKLHKSAKLRKELAAGSKKDKSALPEGKETS